MYPVMHMPNLKRTQNQCWLANSGERVSWVKSWSLRHTWTNVPFWKFSWPKHSLDLSYLWHQAMRLVSVISSDKSFLGNSIAGQEGFFFFFAVQANENDRAFKQMKIGRTCEKRWRKSIPHTQCFHRTLYIKTHHFLSTQKITTIIINYL